MGSLYTLEYLTQDQVDGFYRDGYLHVPSFLSGEDVHDMLERSKQLLDNFDLETHPMTRFTTDDDSHVGDDYFLDSGDKIRYFFEQDAVGKDGKLNRDKRKAVNKIGHALHELDPTFRRVTLQNERMKAVARDLGYHRFPVALQSMVICKQPRIGGEVPEHNDSTFLYTDPPTALGFWIPLETCTPENGALSFLPGSHKTTPLVKRFVRLPGGGTGMESLNVPPEEVPTADPSKYVLQECQPGDLVIIHGTVLHKSPRNGSEKTRFAYTFHMIDTPPVAQYSDRNWLQPTPDMPFSPILDAPSPRYIGPTSA